MAAHEDSVETAQLLAKVRLGDKSARSELLKRHVETVRRTVGRRLDVRVRSRVDPSDVIQETQLDAIKRFDEFVVQQPMPFRLWLIKLTHQRLIKIERHHLRTEKRSVVREMPLPDKSSMNLAKYFVSREPTPDRQMSTNELAKQVRRAVAALPENDREILMLRNFERLSNDEVAQLLEINPETSKKRYTRAHQTESRVVNRLESYESERPMRNHNAQDGECVGRSHEMKLANAVDEFTELLNAGQSPAINNFVTRFPECGPSLRPILETLVAMRAEEVTNHETPVDSFVPDGATLGDFRILRELGRGGMGIVYEAEQISLKRLVALKIMPFLTLLDSPQLKRFRTEARAAAMLKHPNIVSVYSVGCERGVNYYAMELIDGPNLAELLKLPANVAQLGSSIEFEADLQAQSAAQGDTRAIAALSTQRLTDRPSFYRQVAQLGIQIADALEYAHVEGVIHRDIKPANLLLDEQGKPHVADFGLARVQSGVELTMTGDLVGTLRYMSPEQVAGDRLVDQRTDVYSLGLTLYELVAQRPAFEQISRPELIKAIAETEPTPLIRLDRQIPTDLATIVHKSIAKQPEERYQQASKFSEDLRRFLEHRTIQAKRSTHCERLGRLIRRNRVVASLMAIVFALLLGLSIVSTGAALRFATHAKQQAIESRRQKLSLYAREMRLAHLAVNDQQTLYAEDLLLKWVPEAGEKDLRGIEWFHLWARCYRSLAPRTISHDSYIYDVAFSADGRYLADASMHYFIHVWDITNPASGKPIHRIDLPAHAIATLETTQDGSYLIGGGESGYVGIWDWRTYELVDSHKVRTEHPRNMIPALSMNREQSLVALVAFHGAEGSSIVVWDHKHGQQRIVAESAGKAWVAFNANGHILVASPASRHIDTIDPNTGEVHRQQLLEGTWNASEVFPDGKRVAVCYSRHHGDVLESRLEIRRLDNWQLEMDRYLGEEAATDVCISHDGQEIAVGDINGEVLQIPFGGERIARRTIHNDAVRSLVYSPDGQNMASTERSRYAYVFPREPPQATQAMVTRCSIPATVVSGIGYVDEGRTVCTNEGGDLVHFWDAHSGEILGEPLQLEKGPWNLIRIQTDPSRGRVAIVQTDWPFDLDVDEDGKRTNIVPAKVTIWDQQRQATVGRQIFMDDEVFNHVFSFDGKYVAVCGLHAIKIIDLENGETKSIVLTDEFPAEKSWIYACAFSADNQRLYCGILAGTVYVFEVGTWKQIVEPFRADSSRLQSVSCSPDGRFLGSCGFDRRLKLFDPSSHVLLSESDQIPMYPSYVRFSRDGKRAVVGSPEGVVRVYDTETAEEVLNIDVPNHYSVCEFAPDGSSVAIASIVDAMVIHAPGRTALAPLSRAELRNRIREKSRTYRVLEMN